MKTAKITTISIHDPFENKEVLYVEFEEYQKLSAKLEAYEDQYGAVRDLLKTNAEYARLLDIERRKSAELIEVLQIYADLKHDSWSAKVMAAINNRDIGFMARSILAKFKP